MIGRTRHTEAVESAHGGPELAMIVAHAGAMDKTDFRLLPELLASGFIFLVQSLCLQVNRHKGEEPGEGGPSSLPRSIGITWRRQREVHAPRSLKRRHGDDLVGDL